MTNDYNYGLNLYVNKIGKNAHLFCLCIKVTKNIANQNEVK